jgi:hypothetical protein
MIPLNIGKVYSFDTWVPAILGNDYQNVTLQGEMDYETASRSRDVEADHARLFPLLPAGTPNNPEAYTYIKVKTLSGASVILGRPWINEATIETVNSSVMDVTIGGITASDIPTVRQALAANGYNNITITMRDNQGPQ